MFCDVHFLSRKKEKFMQPTIKEVVNKGQLKKWVDFPNKLYKQNPNFVPFLFSDEMATFTQKSNPAYEYCDVKLFLAYHGKKIVGRIGVIVNKAYNEKWAKKAIRFTRFDFIDDHDVSKALFNEVIKLAKEYGLDQAMGPIGFHDMDHEGMLVEGFDELNMSITFYNAPYYLEHMERLGLKKDVDWVEYKIAIPKEVDPRFEKISAWLMRNKSLTTVTYTNRKVLMVDAYEAFGVIDEAFSKLYGTVPLTDKVIKKAINDYISIVNLDYVCSIKDRNGKIVAFAAMVPSIAKALKKSNGRLLPFGIFRMLKALNGKNDVLEMFFVAVTEEYQKDGLTGILMNTMIKTCIKNGVKYCETGPELENNADVRNMWKSFEAVQHKRRRCFITDIKE